MDPTQAILERLRSQVTPEQHDLLRRLWTGGDHLGWVPARKLFHKLPTSMARAELDGLGGSLVAETTGGHEESYVLFLLGALVSERGLEFEELLARFMAYEIARYTDDADLQVIQKAEVQRDLGLSEAALADLFRLLTMGPRTLTNGSSGGSSWSVRVLQNIHDLAEISNWRRFVREHALGNYDPNMPVRATNRNEHLLRRETEEVERRDLPSFWADGKLRVFISHLAKNKATAMAIHDELARRHVSGFVAHAAIEPTKAWELEILAALQTAEALLAIIESGFHDSYWTDQEVGFAMGRDLLVISLQVDGVAPYGFLARSQAIVGREKTAEEQASGVFVALSRHEKTKRRLAEVVVAAFEKSSSFADASWNASLLAHLGYLDTTLARRVRNACVLNPEISLLREAKEIAEAVLVKWKL